MTTGHFLVLAVFVAFIISNVTAYVAPPTLVNTKSGPIQGLYSSAHPSVRVFLGIPYAVPPVGDLRWTPPQPSAPWTNVLNATTPKFACPQNPEGAANIPSLAPSDYGTQNEDCLTLNVWAGSRKSRKLLPVLVWIYGGSFVTGSIYTSGYNGAALAAHGAVVVTINYRLGALGFLVNQELLSGDSKAINFGLLDQQLGLQWVKDNIEQFGGDPSRVTLFGESAGSFSTAYQTVMPSSSGLFRRIVLMSGAPLQRPDDRPSFESQQGISDYMLLYLGCSTIECAKQLTPEQLLSVQSYFEWWPVVDGTVLPKHPAEAIEAGEYNQPLDMVVGTVANEGTLFFDAASTTNETFFWSLVGLFDGDVETAIAVYLAYEPGNYPSPFDAQATGFADFFFVCPARAWLERTYSAAQANGNSVYHYVFSHVPSFLGEEGGALMGAFHGSEVAYFFNVPDSDTMTQEEKRLGKFLSKALVQFADTGKPRGAAQWDPVNRAYSDIGVSKRTRYGYREDQCEFWNALAAGIEAAASGGSSTKDAAATDDMVRRMGFDPQNRLKQKRFNLSK